MGKKSRRKKSSGSVARQPTHAATAEETASALPQLDLSSIDNSHCALCGVYIDPFCWHGRDAALKMCCGQYVCRACEIRNRNERDEAERKAGDLDLQNLSLPELLEIEKVINGPCKVCGTEMAWSGKEHHDRLVRLAEAGHAHAQRGLGRCYDTGTEFVCQNLSMAVEWYKKSIEKGDNKACVALAKLYFHGRGVVQSFEEARQLCEHAGNDVVAFHNLGKMYLAGKGVTQDTSRAMEFFRKSTEQDYPLGMSNYGDLLASEGRLEEALVQYEKGAMLERHLWCEREAISHCQFEAARMLYMLRREDFRDFGNDPIPLVLFWLRRAVKNGNEKAKALLAQVEPLVHSQCCACKKPHPQMECSNCRGVSYCDKACQTAAWKAGHKLVCKSIPKLLSSDECAHCGEWNPRYTCRGCDKAHYCNETCQSAHWKEEHKEECKFL